MNDFDELGDILSAEQDKRKVIKLVDDGVVTERVIQEAKIVFRCQCGTAQSTENNTCIECGADIA